MGFVKTVKILYGYLRPYRRRVALGVLCLLGVDALSILPPLVLKEFIDHAGRVFSRSLSGGYWAAFLPFLLLGLAYALIACGQGAFRYAWRVYLIKSSHRAAERIRDDYFSKLQRLPPSFYDRHPIGDLMALATNDVEAVRFALGPGLLVFADAVFLFLVLPPAMLALSPRLTLVSLAPMALVPFVIGWAEKLVHRRFERVQAQFSKLTAFAQEDIEGIRIVKAFVREWTQLERFGALGKDFVRLNVKLARAQSIFEPVFILSVGAGLAALLFFAGSDVIGGRVPLGTFVAFTRYLDQLVWPMMAFGLAVTYYQRGKGSLKRIVEVLSEKEDDAPAARQPARAPIFDETAPLLEIRGLTFAYGHDEPVLKNVNLRIASGEWVALVGPVGSGKSTIVKLLSGLYPAPRGTVFWKGVDVSDLTLKARRQELAVVPQETLLFSDSLGANVMLGLNSGAGEDQDRFFSAALSRAALISGEREWKFEMPIGEKGSNLSGGERARVTLARAFVREAPLLVLDDALSNIDASTEGRILDRFEDNENSLLMITNRFARLSLFDRVYVLKAGEIAQAGSAAELSRVPGLYRQLLELQLLEDELAH
ncbi:MAG: ABC transporter ATP-binding protein [Deltaproteobacteria bacterium]|nr:ABC transporter ATP-binding protein [Deltaproteobacteria bacterium]